MYRATIITVSLVVAIVRIMGHKSQAFQALAHFLVSGLIVHWLNDRQARQLEKWLAIGLTIVETACFLIGRFHN